MRSGSSGDEIGDDDGLQIKPPQPHRRSRDERNQRRWTEDLDRQRGSLRSDSGSRGDSRRRDYYDHRMERSHASRSQRPVDMEYREWRGEDRVRKRRYEEGSSRRAEIDPSISRSQSDMRRLEQDAHRGDHRSKQLHKSVKQKRKHLELEEQRTLREIEKRHRRERKEEQARSVSTEKRRRKHESPPQTQREEDKDNENVKKLKSPQELDDILVVEDIVKSSPELEEEATLSNSKRVQHPYHSDVSSASDREEGSNVERNTQESSTSKPLSRASSKSNSTDTSSSNSNSDTEDSAGSKSSEDNSEDERDSKNDKEKDTKKANPPLEEHMDKEKVEVKGPSDIETMEVDRKEAPPVVDESLLTDVDRAIREVNLLPPYFPAVQGCRRVEEFTLLNRIEEGTYGVVYRAKDKRTNEVVALKRLKMEKEKDGFPITSLREINTLLKAQHENIVTVREIVVGSTTEKIFLVMDYVEHDLKALMETLKQKSQMFLIQEVKCLMIQLLRAVSHLHDNWILHRDLKTSNLLLSHKGILKVGDFGLAREYGSPLKSYTPVVVTLWYRAPELLLGIKEYSTPIDVWSVGCIFGELLKMEPTFPGKSEANQLNLIFQTLGTPNDRIWPGYSKLPLLQKMTFVDQPMNKLKTRFGGVGDGGIDLMNKLLTYNPAKRITAEEALSHSFFKESPLPIDPSVFPTWPAKSELGHRKAPSSPKPPSGGRQFKDLREDDDSGFFLGTGTGDRRLPMGAGFSLKF